MNPMPTREGPRVNERILVDSVRLIDHEGNNRGVLTTRDARELADEVGMDLVEVSPHTDPPVCKLLDYGKFKYEAQKKANEARKKQKTVEVKEIKMRAVLRFLDEGDKVKVTMRFRGREMAHQERGLLVLDRVRDQLEELVKVEQTPKMEGRQMVMVVAPR